MDTPWHATLAPALASTLLHALWQVTLLALMAALVLRALARHGAAARHVAGLMFLFAMVAMPAATFAHFLAPPADTTSFGTLASATVMTVDAIAPLSVPPPSHGLAFAVSLSWLIGVAAMLLKQWGGWRLIGMLERRAFRPLPPEWQRRVEVLQRALGISRKVTVRLADDVLTPFTARLLRPVIWLPLSLLTRLPSEQVEALLAHELAHVRRLDWLWNGLQCVAESLLFFHPAAWWLGRRIRQEREHACDDLAVAACGDAIALAEALAELERHRPVLPRLVLAARGGALVCRITRLLSPSVHRQQRMPIGIAMLLGSALLIASEVEPLWHPVPGPASASPTEGTLRPDDDRSVALAGPRASHRLHAGVDVRREVRPSFGGHVARHAIEDVPQVSAAPQASPPSPPSPPSPASPTSPTSPPSPASPRSPPSPIADASELEMIPRLVAGDAGVVARTGVRGALMRDAIAMTALKVNPHDS